VLPRAGSKPGSFDQPISSITPQLVSVMAQHPKQLQLVTFPHKPCVWVSPDLRLTRSDWSPLGRHSRATAAVLLGDRRQPVHSRTAPNQVIKVLNALRPVRNPSIKDRLDARLAAKPSISQPQKPGRR
jgi:hypothetical protein